MTRKRFVKLLMSYGYRRNRANRIATEVECYNDFIVARVEYLNRKLAKNSLYGFSGTFPRSAVILPDSILYGGRIDSLCAYPVIMGRDFSVSIP